MDCYFKYLSHFERILQRNDTRKKNTFIRIDYRNLLTVLNNIYSHVNILQYIFYDSIRV